MRTAVRTKSTTEPQLELFTVNALRVPIYETTHSIRSPGREILAGIPAEDGSRTRADGPAAPDAAGSGGANGSGTGRPAPALHPTGADAVPSAPAGLGDRPGALHLSTPRVITDPDTAETESELAAENDHTLEPEPLRNQRNYRITDADKLGVGSLKQKCRQNLAAIELLKKIEEEQRQPSDAEKRVLVRYVGWGGLPQVFDACNEEWMVERDQLESLLTQEELESARATTLNAHYTSPVIIRAMYSVLQRLGFEHGRVLEPACGLGHFIGLMPDSMHARSVITGIEIDSVTARLARMLYPDTDIRHQPFEESRLADNFYDVAISNIPFGDYRPFDPRFKQWSFLIHDYFFAAALAKVRPGGLLLFITSKGSLDKQDGALRGAPGRRLRRMTTSVVTSVSAFFLKASLGRRMEPSR